MQKKKGGGEEIHGTDGIHIETKMFDLVLAGRRHGSESQRAETGL